METDEKVLLQHPLISQVDLLFDLFNQPINCL